MPQNPDGSDARDIGGQDDELLKQVIGVAIFCVVTMGLAHNIFLSAESSKRIILPSTHPATFLCFSFLSASLVFGRSWRRYPKAQKLFGGLALVLASIRLAEAVFPEQVTLFVTGPLPETLAAYGMYGRFSIETALFLVFAVSFELVSAQNSWLRFILTLGCLAVLSLGIVETLFSIFLWGQELSLLTQVAMWAVSIGLLFRIRRKLPFHSETASNRSMVRFQMLAGLVFLLPILGGLALVTVFGLPVSMRLQVEVLVAAGSWSLLCLVLLVGMWIERRRHAVLSEAELADARSYEPDA